MVCKIDADRDISEIDRAGALWEATMERAENGDLSHAPGVKKKADIVRSTGFRTFRLEERMPDCVNKLECYSVRLGGVSPELVVDEPIGEKAVYEGDDIEGAIIASYKAAGYWAYDLHPKAGIKDELEENLPPHVVEVLNYVEIGPGLPDILVYDDKNVTFVEVKHGPDKLRESQIEWMSEHPDVDTKVVHVPKKW